MLSLGWGFGALVGASLAWAAWEGHFEALRSSLALLATAAIVVIVLGSDALRQGAERGFATPARQAFGGTAVWMMVVGLLGVVLAAMVLPWLGPAGPLFGPRGMEAVYVGFVGFLLGVTLCAPLALALSDVTSRRREDESPPPEQIDESAPRRDDSGLTTLEWLLIVAAVAGLAALAVVLVQRQVEDTSLDIAAEQPRVKAAEVAGEQITREARQELSEDAAGNTADSVAVVNAHYGSKCDRLAINYRGLDLSFTWHAAVAGNPRPANGVTESLCTATQARQ